MKILVLWCVVFLLGLYLRNRSVGQKHVLSSYQSKRRKNSLWGHLFEKEYWFTRRGFFVQWYVSKDRYRKLLQLHGEWSLEKFQRIKQMSWNSFWLFFWINVWMGNIQGGNLFVWVGIGGIFFFVPDIYVRFYITRRNKQVFQNIPYFLDLLVLALRSGMNVQQAFVFVTQKKKNILEKIIQKALLQIQWGKSFEEVLQEIEFLNLGQDMTRIINSIYQSQKLGISLADTLVLQSDLIRTQRRQRMEELSRTASVKISLPLVFCIFPALLILYLGPGILLLLEK